MTKITRQKIFEKIQLLDKYLSYLRQLRKEIKSKNLFSRLKGVVGFRNILVHEYGKIDQKKVYQYLMEKLEDFEVFKKEILTIIKSRED